MSGELKPKEGSATAVVLDRNDEGSVILRFLLTDVSWDVHTREVRLTPDLAEQLMKMLESELEEEQKQAQLRYQLAF